MNRFTNFFVAACCLTLLASSCASLTGFEEGRSMGKDNSELIASLNLVSSPDILSDVEDVESVDNLAFPNIEFSYKYGVTEQLDVGARVSTNLNSSTFVKYQLVGDRTSNFALAPGLEIGTVLGLAYSLSLPVFTSFYPSDNVVININPRFTYLIGADIDSGIPYLGGNVGLLFGKRNKFGLDLGYYNVDYVGQGSRFLTFGVGGKFRFGDNDAPTTVEEDSRSSRSKKRRKRR